MKTFAFAAILGSALALSEIEASFMAYITQFNKSYKNAEEYEMRLREFAVKHVKIQESNADPTLTYKAGHNKFSDWTDAEYKAMLTYKPSDEEREYTNKIVSAIAPIDWRNTTNGLNCMNPIQDQGQCGSCWAFSTQGSMETNECIANGGTLQKYSEQQLVDCVKTCYGCNGGLTQRACYYLQTHNEILESDYIYLATDTACAYDSKPHTNVICGQYAWMTPNDPASMQNALNAGVISVSIQADQFCFQTYTSGIFNNPKCGTSLDHATVVVGWGTDDVSGQDYWIMRNSWGTSWGESGYMKIEISTTVNSGAGYCGIQSEPIQLYPNTN
jgi:C1A family cysteine protease